MRSIDKIFLKLELNSPYAGRCILLKQAVCGKGFSAETIARAVNRLTTHDDYAGDMRVKKQFIADLISVSKPTEDAKKSA